MNQNFRTVALFLETASSQPLNNKTIKKIKTLITLNLTTLSFK